MVLETLLVTASATVSETQSVTESGIRLATESAKA